jgi:GT2 family glycosyltransferase
MCSSGKTTPVTTDPGDDTRDHTGDLSVTVVIATQNRVDELCRTVGRLTELPERPAIVVVDNASDDGTPARVRGKFPDVTVVSLSRNIGASARNIGVARATTRYVAISDDDSWWEPGSLSRAVAVLDDHPDVGLIAAQTLVESTRAPDPLNTILRMSPLPRGDLPGPRVLGFLAGAALVRRDPFLAAGGFSEMLFIGGEEDLLAIDLATAGWAAVYVEDVTACHWPSALRDDAERRCLLARNEVITAWLRRPAAVAWPLTASLVRRARWDPVARRALRSLLRLLPSVLVQRHVVSPGLESQLRRLEQERAERFVAVEAGGCGQRRP